MTKLEDYRVRAVKLLIQRADKTVPMLIDYHLDDFLRNLLNLPSRPVGQEPYIGWMASDKEPTRRPVKTSRAGVDLIKKWEGMRTNAYLCPAGVWTIGYGHTRTAHRGLMISHEKAEQLLKEDLELFEVAVRNGVTVPINQNQFDALISFTYNVGIGAFSKSTLLMLLNQSKTTKAAEQFIRWTRGGGQILPGLVSRRREEYELFMS